MNHRPIDVAVNPNNTAQRYILWTNGRIDNQGGAPPIVGPGWYDQVLTVAAALHITDWVAGKGYVLSIYGEFIPLGGATDLMTGTQVVGDETRNIVPGIEYFNNWHYIDWQWNPNGNGQGYCLDRWGKVWPFGGATAPTVTGPRFVQPLALRLRMQWSPSKLGLVLTVHGGLYSEFGLVGVLANPGNRTEPALDWARDFFVTDWSTNPPKGYTLDLHAETHGWGGAPLGSNTGTGMWLRSGAASVLHVLSTADPVRIWQVWWGGQQFEYTWTGPPTVKAGGGSNETQKVTITGSPTGGNFKLTFDGQTTADIAYNASAATVQTRLEALSNIVPGDVTVTKSSWVYTVAFAGNLAQKNVAQMTATHTFTGGSSPSVAVTTTIEGVDASPSSTVTATTRPVLAWSYSDPQQDSQLAWQLLVFTQAFVDAHNMTDPLDWSADALVALEGSDRGARGLTSPVHLANGSYRFYVRAQDTAEQWSAWSNRGWSQSVTLPATPTGLTATANTASLSVDLTVSTVVSENSDYMLFEYTDDGATWLPVRGADAVPLTATTTAVDHDSPLGKSRTYRATAYSIDPQIASTASATATATVAGGEYTLRSVADVTLGGVVGVQGPVEWTRPVVVGLFQGVGADYVTAVSDGAPKGRRTTLRLVTVTRAEWDLIDRLVKSDSTLVYRDPFGEVLYCRLAGDWSALQLPAAPLMTETTPLRHAHTVELPLVEVAPPGVTV